MDHVPHRAPRVEPHAQGRGADPEGERCLDLRAGVCRCLAAVPGSGRELRSTDSGITGAVPGGARQTDPGYRLRFGKRDDRVRDVCGRARHGRQLNIHRQHSEWPRVRGPPGAGPAPFHAGCRRAPLARGHSCRRCDSAVGLGDNDRRAARGRAPDTLQNHRHSRPRRRGGVGAAARGKVHPPDGWRAITHLRLRLFRDRRGGYPIPGAYSRGATDRGVHLIPAPRVLQPRRWRSHRHHHHLLGADGPGCWGQDHLRPPRVWGGRRGVVSRVVGPCWQDGARRVDQQQAPPHGRRHDPSAHHPCGDHHHRHGRRVNRALATGVWAQPHAWM
mmetsp:Transcript_6723/g.16194  ORF Transcript_6723/g.16194 Transcript_6723/m.16194 type:complete len:331 (-) Transcript_6723:2647-3639(-)